MKQKVKGLVFSFIITSIALLIGCKIGNVLSAQDAQLKLSYIEIGQKMADVEWLHRFGYVSSDELNSLADASKNGLSLDEFDALLNYILDGKKEDCLESWDTLLGTVSQD